MPASIVAYKQVSDPTRIGSKTSGITATRNSTADEPMAMLGDCLKMNSASGLASWQDRDMDMDG